MVAADFRPAGRRKESKVPFAEHFAEPIGDLGIPLYRGIKNVYGREQKKLSEKGRGENAYKSYAIPEKYRDQLKGRRVILIDDIVTTGATAVSCAALCKLNGALSVSCFCVAKTPRKFSPKGDKI